MFILFIAIAWGLAGFVIGRSYKKYKIMVSKYSYRFPIGDWSCDGHCKCEWFTAIAAKPVTDARKAHHACIDVLGFDIGDICGDYEENIIDPDIIKILLDKNVITTDWLKKHIESISDSVGTIYSPSAKELFLLWIRILNFIDPDLNLKYKEDKNITYYGYDKKYRHLSCPGYGIFGS